MFTGIITHIGRLKALVHKANHDLLITVELTNQNLDRELNLGCSIACSGICLTLVNKSTAQDQIDLTFQVSNETVLKTNIEDWSIGKKINLEFSLRLHDELGGSIVSGHIDGTTNLQAINQVNDSYQLTFLLPTSSTKFICPKGSVVIEGICLTVNDVGKDYFTINIIPHTFKNTNLHDLTVGSRVNLEFDLFARYINRIVELSHG